METAEKKLKKIDIKREELRQISRRAEEIRKQRIKKAQQENNTLKIIEFEAMTVNECIHEFVYHGEEMNSFKKWRDKGFTVKKGAKAKLFWAQPQKVENIDTDNGKEERYKFFPIAFVFAASDVLKLPDEE